MLAMIGPRRGSSEATLSQNGSHPVPFCGFVANVSPPYSLLCLHTEIDGLRFRSWCWKDHSLVR
jgi:hypothetical protein